MLFSVSVAMYLLAIVCGSQFRCVVPPRSSAPTVAGGRLGGYPVGRDRWGGKRAAGEMSEDNDRCVSTLVLGAFSTGVWHYRIPWEVNNMRKRFEFYDQSRDSMFYLSFFFSTVFINAGARLLCTSDGICVIVYVKFSSVGAGTVLGGGGLLFILGLNLGGVGPVRGLRGG
jgi:hypothetical protein